ncbi:MAG: N,N-dimethylformamidase beta subunit [Planctomycetota bacterium]
MFSFKAFLLLCILFQQPDADKLIWKEAAEIGLENQGWKETLSPYDRLPKSVEKVVRPPVWNLSRNSAGLACRFVTDSSEIHAQWTLTSPNLAMPHMPATGVSGLDLYARDDKGAWKWVANGRPSAVTNKAALATGLPKGKREYLIYLPLYNGVKELKIGVTKGAILEKAPPRAAHLVQPIVYYGTSIAQGGCASRPGMAHTNILHRMLERPVINLGFSGNGTLDPEFVPLFAEIDASVYVLDCLPNLDAKRITERLEPFVIALRKAKPLVPILLVEDRTYTNAGILSGVRQKNDSNRKAHADAVQRLKDRGITGLFVQLGEPLMGDDGEATVDSSHPTDLGFLRQAQVMLPTLKPLLPAPAAARPAIEGYFDKLSYLPREKVSLKVSSAAASFGVEIARVGARREVVLVKNDLACSEQKIPDNASSHGCDWKESFGFEIPGDWRTGYYNATLSVKNKDGKVITSDAFFVVRNANPGKDSKILIQLSTNTYNAYCNWGGYSLYAYNGKFKVQGRRVSFERPMAGQFRTWEYPFIKWAEESGFVLDYAINSDLEHHPEILKNYKLVLSVGHDEYWSTPMRDNLEKFISDGGNVAFFSGNTCCWQVRSEDSGRALVCFKQAFRDDPLFEKGDPKLISSLWSHHLLKRPENTLTGVGFLWGGYHRSHGQFMDGSASFTVHRPEHWIFQNTNMKKDSTFGGKDTIVGYECDGCQLVWKDGLPSPTFSDGTPRNFSILATAPAKWHPDDCEWYEHWEKGRLGNAVMGTYSNNGTVVTVGTTDWAHGLAGKDPTTMTITRNIIEKLMK